TELPSKPTPKARLTGFEGLLHLLLILLRSDGPSCLENVSLERIARGTSLIHQRHSRLTSGLCLLLFGSGSTLRKAGCLGGDAVGPLHRRGSHLNGFGTVLRSDD